jgi:hypothetical protein
MKPLAYEYPASRPADRSDRVAVGKFVAEERATRPESGVVNRAHGGTPGEQAGNEGAEQRFNSEMSQCLLYVHDVLLDSFW